MPNLAHSLMHHQLRMIPDTRNFNSKYKTNPSLTNFVASNCSIILAEFFVALSKNRFFHAHDHLFLLTNPPSSYLCLFVQKWHFLGCQINWSINAHTMGTIIFQYLCSKTIFVNVKILICYDEISIFAFTKILLSEDT